MTEPLRPLTRREQDVARCMARGLPYKAGAAELGVSVGRFRNIVYDIAGLLANDDGLTPHRLVHLWAAHQKWEAERESAA